jgi:chemotaxis signal transduction protein
MTGLLAGELARAFDDEFARPIARRSEALLEFLAIRVGAEPYALARSDLAGLFVDKRLTPLPGAGAGLLGIAGFRSVLVPVYDLRALLGIDGAGPPPRWLAATAAAPVALAFDRFERYLRVPSAAIAGTGGPGSQVRHAVCTAGETRPVIDVTSRVEALRGRRGSRAEPPP